jgi:hypothetical protein
MLMATASFVKEGAIKSCNIFLAAAQQQLVQLCDDRWTDFLDAVSPNCSRRGKSISMSC